MVLRGMTTERFYCCCLFLVFPQPGVQDQDGKNRANKPFNADSFPKIEYLKFLLSMLYLVVFTFTEEVPFLKSTLGHLQKIVVLCAEKVKMDGGWKGTGG